MELNYVHFTDLTVNSITHYT